ncbi:MAG: L,D-transpeptidase [Candidatus Dormibacteria bacterium]
MAVITAPATSPRRSESILRLWPRALLLLLIAACIAMAVLVSVVTSAAAAYHGAVASLDQDVAAARFATFTTQDLQPILSSVAALKATPAPHLGDRLAFYQHQRLVAEGIRSQLTELRLARLAAYRSELDAQETAARAAVAQAHAAGVANSDLAPIQKALDAAVANAADASRPQDFRAVIAALAPVISQATDFGKVQAAENAAIEQRIASLKAAHPGDIDGTRKEGQAALTSGRNDGVLAGWLNLHQLDRQVARIEEASASLGSADIEQVTRAAATLLVRNDNFHASLAAAMPSKVVAMSLTDQRLWAYENGKVVFSTLITSGRPQLPTDTGPMSVLWKVTPWKMHSPWPRSSQWWYPDTTVRKVVWFTNTGEGMHDANWEPDSMYGPGSQFNQNIASHGCVHMPGTTVDWMYDWAPVGTPVIVMPGDGSPTAEQLKHDTIDTVAGQTAPHGS